MGANTSYLNDHQAREEAADRKQDAIDALATDIFNEKLYAIAHMNMTGSDFQKEAGYNCWNAISDIPSAAFHDIGVAISTGDELEAGRLLISAVRDVLRKIAKDEAEEALEE